MTLLTKLAISYFDHNLDVALRDNKEHMCFKFKDPIFQTLTINSSHTRE